MAVTGDRVGTMSDESAAELTRTRREWAARHRDAYLRSGGVKGHIMDVTDAGGHRFTTHCLIRVPGRRTGTLRITPLIYGDIGGEIAIVASKGGADHHPDWYLNLRATEHVDVQIATQAFRTTWREPEDEERHKVWDFMTGIYPPYLAYQIATPRHIPVVMLTPVETIDVFTPTD
jgi:deazaflavin-dependent oxidoreductase (nitroreductase family)